MRSSLTRPLNQGLRTGVATFAVLVTVLARTHTNTNTHTHTRR